MPFVVLQSYPEPRPTTNPYIVMLGRSLTALPDVEVLTFTWKRALTGRYDAFHVHWPETRLSGRTAPRRLAQQVLFALLLARLRLTRTPIVRTAHNLRLPDGISRRERALLNLTDRWTTLRIRLNPTTELPRGQAHVTIPLGHFTDWFAPYPATAAVPGRIAYFGLIRRYKGVEGLIRAFRGLSERHGEHLVVAGKPSNEKLRQSLVNAAEGDPDIELNLTFLSDDQLVSTVTAAELVVLPYREMHNSAGALTALSLGRPVLMPNNAVNELLASEFGPGWIFGYDGDLTPDDLRRVLAELADLEDGRPGPDLSARGWTQVGTQHLAAYRRAVQIVKKK